MKTIKTALLFYSSILIFSLVTIGFITQPYQSLTPTLLLLPVGVYFTLLLINQFSRFSYFVKNQKANHLKRILRLYSLVIIVLLISASLATGSGFLQSTLTLIFLPLLASFVFNLLDRKVLNKFRLEKIITLNKLFSKKSALEKPVVSGKPVVSAKSAESESAKLKKSGKSKSTKDSKKSEGEILLEEDNGTDERILGLGGGELITEGLLGEEVPGDGLENLIDVRDGRRRQFLKIIGGGGVSLFLMLFVFQQKASASFFGSAPGPGIVGIKDSNDTKIDPSEKQPTDGYNISEIDDASSPAYYGFVHKNGAWYIAKENSSGAYRYISGASDFSTSWTSRASLSYDYFDNIF